MYTPPNNKHIRPPKTNTKPKDTGLPGLFSFQFGVICARSQPVNSIIVVFCVGPSTVHHTCLQPSTSISTWVFPAFWGDGILTLNEIREGFVFFWGRGGNDSSRGKRCCCCGCILVLLLGLHSYHIYSLCLLMVTYSFIRSRIVVECTGKGGNCFGKKTLVVSFSLDFDPRH